MGNKENRVSRKDTKARISRKVSLRLCVFFAPVRVTALLLLFGAYAFAQSPSPTPAENRGLGIQSAGQTPNNSGNQGSREAKPELVLQTGYSNFFGAARLIFSPDGRLLATATYRSNTIKLWETATTRKLRDLSNSGQ